jgi:hypothetical protein
MTLVNWMFIWDSRQLFLELIKRLQCFSTIAKKDHFTYSKQSLSIAHIMGCGDNKCPPGDLECTPCRHPCGTENTRRTAIDPKRTAFDRLMPLCYNISQDIYKNLGIVT